MGLLQIEELRTYFRTRRGMVRAVDGADMTINSGDAVGLVGESGCGKSTLAFSVLRLVPSPPGSIEGGRIIFKGRDLLGLGPDKMRRVRGREISMIFQDPMTYLNPVMTIGDQIAESIRLHQPSRDAKKATTEALESVRMPRPRSIAESYPHQLSGGMKQRALIAMAIACRPSLLIADEPTTALDVTVQAQILSLILDLRDRLGTTLLLITHDLGIVAEVCDRVYVMYAGQIVEAAPVFDLFENPKHPYTHGLLRSVLSIDEFKETLEYIPGVVPDLISPPPGCRFAARCPERVPRCTTHEPPPLLMENGSKVCCWLYERE